MRRRGLYVTVGSFSLVNERLKNALLRAAPDFELTCFDAAGDTFRSRPALRLFSQFFATCAFAPAVVSHKIPPRELMVRLPFFQSYLSKALSEQARDKDFTLQTQSLFDARVEGVPNFAYTDHTYLANLRYHPPRSTWAVSSSWLGMEKSLYKKARVCFTTSRFAADSIVEDYSVPRERVETIYSGCNTELPAFIQRPERLPRRIIFVGYEWERKGGPTLVKAFASVQSRFPDARLDIVGDAPRFSGPGIFVHGRVDRSELPALLQKADIFCLPSIADPSAAALVEASAFGLPVVATLVGGAPERVLDGRTGILVKPSDVESLAAALCRLMEDANLGREMGMRGREFVLQQFTWAAVASKMANRIRSELS